MTHLNEGGNVKKKAKDGLPADKWKELARGLKHYTQSPQLFRPGIKTLLLEAPGFSGCRWRCHSTSFGVLDFLKLLE